MGSMQTIHQRQRRYRVPSAAKFNDNAKYKRADRSRTTMRSVTLRAIAGRNSENSVASSNNSRINCSSSTSPTTITTINSQLNTDPYLSDFDYRKLSTLTGLSESKVNELHREFLILSDNGRLTYEKYKSMLETISDQTSSTQLEKLTRQTFALFDKDGNNYLDFAEFIAAYIAMEKNELFSTNKSQPPPPSPIIPRQATAYYSPYRTLINTPPPPQTGYHLRNYPTYYHPQSSERYVYATSPYTYR